MATQLRNRGIVALDSDPLWYKDAIIYELHVRAFLDSSGDGHGDFPGLTQKLDYLQDLGVTALWLLPFYPSPLRDDGYDIARYKDVHPNFGTLHDFRVFLREAHARGLRVITELVLNHTSDQHAWFQRARRAKPGSSYHNFYVWSDTPERYRDTRVIFRDFEPSNWTWDPVANAYYWHRFYSHQPDLNFDNPQVRRALTRVVDFWLGMGVDGLRLDAVPYLYEREGTSNENLPETHAYLKQLRAHVDGRFGNRMLLAEANQWPEEAAAYFGDGDECHMAFHFPLMPRLFMSIRMEDRFPIIDIMQQTPVIPETSQWALFLRNHDELTLEMVTDEDRDYMYRSYAHDPQARINLGIRHRLAPLLGNDRRKIELMNGLLFSLPGTPVVYYGDEIGMGDNIFLGDRNGVRTPMQWNGDRNAGFSRANPHRLYLPVVIDPEYHYEAINVEAQQNNSQSLLWWMKRTIALRKRHRAFGNGRLEFLNPENRKVLAYLRIHHEETILVVANLSRSVQFVNLDLSRFAGTVPIELSGRTAFPPVGAAPYMLTLSPYSFFWFGLETPTARPPALAKLPDVGPPVIAVRGSWEHIFQGRARIVLQRLLPAYLAERSWFAGASRSIVDTQILEAAPLPVEGGTVYLTMLRVEYAEGEAEVYQVPLAFAGPEEWEALQERLPNAFIARVRVAEPEPGAQGGLLYDALGEPAFSTFLFDAIRRRRRIRGQSGEVVGLPARGMRDMRPDEAIPDPSRWSGEQSNTSVTYGERFIMKVFRRVDTGVNPELEILRFLSGTDFSHMPTLTGALEYKRGLREEPETLALLERFVPNEGSAWLYTLDALDRYFDRVLAEGTERDALPEMTAGCVPARAAFSASSPASGGARILPAMAATARPAHGTAPPGAGLQDGGPRLCARGLSPGPPAIAVPGEPRDAATEPGPPSGQVGRAARGHRGGGAASAGVGGGAPPRSVPYSRRPDGRPTHPRARRLPSGAGAVHRQGLRHHRLRRRAVAAHLPAPAETVAAGRRGRHAALLPLRRGDRLEAGTPPHRRPATADRLGPGLAGSGR